ncbi:hypothetical protein [Pedobacter sp. JCM 36344]|uniref:hypothetical protein n=1 Tax=Pedobacter sp. JCM 36344 TaxID=3374280 RepID=UPI00397ABA66
MKYLISVLSLLFILQQGSAQNLDSLNQKMVGTWELTSYLSTNNGTGNESPDKIKRARVITKSNYILSLYDVKTGKFIGKIIGNYSLSDTQFGDLNYQEKAASVTSGFESFLSKVLRKSVFIDEADRMVFLWTDKYIKYTEIWSRVIENNGPEKLPQ